MTGNVKVNEPGSVRRVQYFARRGADGKYPVTLWGSLEEQIREATARNLEEHSNAKHVMSPLWLMADDCEHVNPDEDERFADVDDLIAAWMDRNCPGLRGAYRGVEWDLYYKNTRRAYAVIPLAAEYQRKKDEYDDGHNRVCYDNPMGDYCEACTEGDDDSGYEPARCRRRDEAQEQYSEFWWRFSAENTDIGRAAA